MHAGSVRDNGTQGTRCRISSWLVARGDTPAALEEPLQTIAYNAGYDPATIVAQVKRSCAGYGLDARTGAIVDMVEAGIVDPVQVLQAALTAAVSGAIVALTTDVLVHGQKPIMMARP